MAGVLQSANSAILASGAGAYNLGITNLDDDNEPAFTGTVEVNGAYFKFTAEAPTGVSGISSSTTYYISVVVNTGVTPNTATLECEATTGYTVNQTKNGIYDATGAKRAVLQCYKSGNGYAIKKILMSSNIIDGTLKINKTETSITNRYTYNGSAVPFGQVYDAITSSGVIQNVGDTVIINGGFGNGTSTYVISHAVRLSSTEINLYYIGTNVFVISTITTSTTGSVYITMAW